MNNTLLLRALTLNGWFSGASALTMILTGGWLAAQFGLSSAFPVYAVAGGLAVFALQLANIVRTKEIRTWEIASIVVGDLVWVIGSIVVMALYHDAITQTGLLLIDAVAATVLIFAIMQMLGFRQYRRQFEQQGSQSL